MTDDSARWGFETRAIHAGQEPDPRTGSVIVPIYATSTFLQDGVGGVREGGYEYSRTANPTRTALEEALAALEGGRHGLAFASGMAAPDVALVTSDDELHERFGFLRNAVGAVPSPFDSWLVLRGAKTLALRMERHSDNAERIVEALVGHPKVTRVYYPGLPEHPGHEVAAKQ